MAEFRRRHVDTLVQRLSEPPQRLIAVFGPRQTGKTTATRQGLQQIRLRHRYEAIDAPEPRADLASATSEADYAVFGPIRRDARWLEEVWEQCRHQAWISPQGFVLVLDEIQKIEQWSNLVKGLWDADRASGCPLHVVVLGSAPILMQAGLSESLAGRFEPIHVRHWSYPEMADAFGYSLDEYVYFGGYPGAASLSHDQERWRAYIRGALLAMLQARLPSEVDVAREGHYVSGKRADIRLSYGGFNVPIEIKKDSHRDLWSALQRQLVDQYSSTDRAASGYGIYLVLWTGGDKIRRRPDGNRPATPDELRELLEGDLTPDQANKISVTVLDVTKP